MTNITFEKLSRTAATGNPPQPGSPGEGTQTNPHAITNSVPRLIPSTEPAVNSRAQGRELSILGRELLAGLLFFLVPLFAALVVLLSAFVYAALVA